MRSAVVIMLTLRLCLLLQLLQMMMIDNAPAPPYRHQVDGDRLRHYPIHPSHPCPPG
jgi:hypothetical protein